MVIGLTRLLVCCLDGDRGVPNNDKVETEKFLTSEEKQDETEECVQKQPVRWKLKLFALYCIFLGLGFGSSLTGPTMVDMEEWLDTDTSGMSVTLAVGSVGYMLGSALCSVVFDRFRLEFQLLFDTFLIGSSLALAPWPRNLVAYSVFIVVRGVAMGLIDSSGQGYLLSLMEGHRFRNPAMQLLHGLWSVGASTGPLIIKPFLRPDLQHQHKVTNTSNPFNTSTEVPVSYTATNMSLQHLPNISNAWRETYSLRVPYAFLTIGVSVMILGIPMFVAYVSGPLSIWVNKKKKEKEVQGKSQPKEPKKFRLIMLTLLFIWFYFYLWAEDLPGSYLAPFVIKHLGWPRSTGPLITTTLWGSHGIGRLLAVPISVFATPRQMIITSMTLTAAGYVLMLALMHVHPAAVWISVGLAGLGMASSFGTMILWSSKYIHVRGTASAVFVLGCSSGGTTAPLISGFLFEKVSPVWVIHLMLIGAVLDIAIYIIMEIYVHCGKAKNSSTQTSAFSKQNHTENENGTKL